MVCVNIAEFQDDIQVLNGEITAKQKSLYEARHTLSQMHRVLCIVVNSHYNNFTFCARRRV